MNTWSRKPCKREDRIVLLRHCAAQAVRSRIEYIMENRPDSHPPDTTQLADRKKTVKTTTGTTSSQAVKPQKTSVEKLKASCRYKRVSRTKQSGKVGSQSEIEAQS